VRRRWRLLLMALVFSSSALAAVPMRVVTLAPHLTELVFAAGAGERIIGTLDTSDFPLQARRIERIGDSQHIDAERLVELKPDLVLVWGDGQPAAERAMIERLRLPALALAQHGLDDVPADVERLGLLFGTQTVAGAEAARLRTRLAELRHQYAGVRRLRVFWQVWSAPLYTLGGRHVATEMLNVCGADNIFAEQTQSAVAVDEEAVLARNPDVLVLTGSTIEMTDWIHRWKQRVQPRALKSGAVIMLDPDLVTRMGPRLIEGTRQLCEHLAGVRALRH